MIESRNINLSALRSHTEIHLSCSTLPWLVSSAGETLGMYKSKPLAVSNAGIAPTDWGSGVKLNEFQRDDTFISPFCIMGA